jgi:hypothetical protein
MSPTLRVRAVVLAGWLLAAAPVPAGRVGPQPMAGVVSS